MKKNIKIGAIDDIVGVYRVNGLGVWTSKTEKEKFISNITYILHFLRVYKDPLEYQQYLLDNLHYFVKDFFDKNGRLDILQSISLTYKMFFAGVRFRFILNFLTKLIKLK